MADDAKSPAADIAAGKSEYIWKSPVGDRPSRGTWYYIALVALAAVLAGAFFWVGQPLSVLVVASALLFFLTHANESPRAHRYAVNADGIAIEKRQFEYATLKAFWIAEHAGGVTLYADRLGRLTLPLSIPLQPDDVAGIRGLLRQHLPESKQRGELMADVVARITGIS